MTIGAVLDGGAAMPSLEFELPSSFQAIDLSADAADRGAELYAKLQATQLPLTEDQRLWLLLTNQRLVERMIREGVLYAATFFGRSERDRTALTTAQFTVTVQRRAFESGSTLEELAGALREHREGCAVEQVRLSIGAALAIVEDDHVELSRDPFGNENGAIKHVRQLQIVLPLTSKRQLVFFGISTECIRDWNEYVEMMAEICKTIRWQGGAGERNRISAVLNQG